MDRKIILFLLSILALTIVVFNNIVQLLETWNRSGFSLNLVWALILTSAGVGIYSLINRRINK